MSTWALGLANDDPETSSSTTPPAARSTRYQSGMARAMRPRRAARGTSLPLASRRSMTRLPSPAPLLSCLTTTPRAPGWARRILLTARATSARSWTSSWPTGVGTPVSWKTRRAALLKPSDHRPGAVPLMGRPRRSATATSAAVTFQGSIMAGRPATIAVICSSASGRCRSATATGSGSTQGATTTCMRERTLCRSVLRQEPGVVVEHPLARVGRGHEHQLAARDVRQLQHGDEVAVLQRDQARCGSAPSSRAPG